MKNIRQMQIALRSWQQRNFPSNTKDQMLKGMIEEFGELCHADLKQEQGIREGADGSNIDYLIGDSWADMTIYGLQYLSSLEINCEEFLRTAAWVYIDDAIAPRDGNRLLKNITVTLGKLVESDLHLEDEKFVHVPDNLKYKIGSFWAAIVTMGILYLQQRNICSQTAFDTACTEVLARDWVAFPVNGRDK